MIGSRKGLLQVTDTSERLTLLEERVDDLTLLTDKIEALEDRENTLIEEVKDIMTVFENRVLNEIENLSEARIEPMDKITSGLMLTVADLTAKITAFLDVYAEDRVSEGHDSNEFSSRIKKLSQQYQSEMLRSLKEKDGSYTSQPPEEDSSVSNAGDTKDN